MNVSATFLEENKMEWLRVEEACACVSRSLCSTLSDDTVPIAELLDTTVAGTDLAKTA